MALVPALIVPIKELTARPGTPVMPPGTGYFPSGHTATAAIAYGGATLLLLPWLRSGPTRRALLVTCATLVLAVSFGLVRRGYHWPLDVVASWCLCGYCSRRCGWPSGGGTPGGLDGTDGEAKRRMKCTGWSVRVGRTGGRRRRWGLGLV